MTEREPGDLESLHGQHTTIEQVTVTEDVDGIPAWIKVDREQATVVIVPSLLRPRAPRTPAVDSPRQADPAPLPHPSSEGITS
ncbi:hypothetical protein [Microbacterium hominis]|uniref:hypothetical protein n=1 Tax=Microbacterium hominis TaxID=162426 RepID=UPI000A6EE8C4|nr:hypothetical protein [Microbacterium hominis]